MYKTNNVKEEQNVNNVGADASVCPNATKACPKKMGNRLNQPAAITLVALVITIIILIILAGVSLNLALGQNGIFTKSKQAVDKYKDEAQKEQNTLENIYQDMIADEPFVKPAFNQETDINLNPETAQNAEKYGWKVEGYDEALDKVGCWRLFYQDDTCTYLISDNLIKGEDGTEFVPSDYYTSIYKDENKLELKYQSGADVSTVGQKLNPMLLNDNQKRFFDENIQNKNPNIRATAWLTDTTQWTNYKNDDAEFAIGSPTVELYAASFDAAAIAAKEADPSEERKKIGTGLSVGDYGYTEKTVSGDLKQSYNKGIYNKDGSSCWWLASPDYLSNRSGLYVKGISYSSCFSHNDVDGKSNTVRPIVCIQTIVFDEFLNSGKYELIDDKVVGP